MCPGTFTQSAVAKLIAIFVLVFAWPMASVAGGQADQLDVNDVSFLWPAPTSTGDLNNLISGDDKVADGTTLWPEDAFRAVLAAAKQAQITNSTGKSSGIQFDTTFKPDFENLHTWKVAGIRIDPSAPGNHEDIVALAGSTPQVRLIFQPVTVHDGKLRIHDLAAHVVFDFVVGTSRPAVPDKPAFQQIVDDLVSLKAELSRVGVTSSGKLGVHPAFKTPAANMTNRLRDFLKEHANGSRINALAFMGIRSPEPWFFFPMRKVSSEFKAGLAVMLTVGNFAVQPVPTNHNLGTTGVSTAQLFGNVAAHLDDSALAGGVQVPDTSIRIRDIADFIANPHRVHVLNTDCVSCHTESTRRRALKLADAPNELRYLRPADIAGVDEAILPQTPWNVRNFGWGSEGGIMRPTVTLRTANEAADSVAFIRREYLNPPANTNDDHDASNPVSNPLTLVMTVKSADDAKQLRALLDQFQNLPPSTNPIAVALSEIGTVHDARFVFIGDDKLVVITTYDDDFDRYIDAFVTAIGTVFDQLLSHIKDAPPVPIAEHRDEFLAFVKQNDLSCVRPFYSAYPTLRVNDILTLQKNSEHQ